MHRSSSYMSGTSGAGGGGGGGGIAMGRASAVGLEHLDQPYNLPTYDPQSDAAKKEALASSRAHLSESLVHLIPLVIIFCALLLWSFSSSSEVGVMVEKRGDEEKMVAHVKNAMPDGGFAGSWNGSGMMTGMEDLDPIDKVHGVVSTDEENAGGRELEIKGPKE